jgi:hypothetical protein
MIGNEMFLDSAQLRSSVVSRAKMLGYIPTSRCGATTTLQVTIEPNDSPASISIAKNTEFTTTVDGSTYTFVTPQEYTITESNGVYSSQITIVEGVPITQRYTVSSNNPIKYVIPNKNVDMKSITVRVENSAGDSTSTTYNLANDVIEVDNLSKIFFLQEILNEEIEIYFGDGVLGYAPINGNIVVIEYRISAGADGNDIDEFTGPGTLGGYSTYDFTVDTLTYGGTDIESIDSIKFNAPKNYSTQNRAVIAEDYKRIILRDNSDIQSLNVWAGEDNTPPIYGKVYICVKPTNDNTLTQTRKDLIKAEIKKYNVLSIDVEFVDPAFLYINPTITVNYNSALTTLSASAIQTKILDNIVNYENTYLGTFDNNRFRYSSFLKAIDASDISIQSSLVTMQIEKRLSPTLNSEETYRLSFNNPLDDHTTLNESALTSSSFTYQGKTCYFDDDGVGNVRIYYITTSNVKTYIDNNIGTLNYTTGLLTLNTFGPTAAPNGEIRFYGNPDINDIITVRNQLMLIGRAAVTLYDEKSQVITATTAIATTSGIVTQVVETGFNAVVY